MDISAPGSSQTALRHRTVLALAAVAWLAASAIMWAASAGQCSGDCHHLSAGDLQTAFAVAVGAVIVFIAGPPIIAALAFRFGSRLIGYVFIAITVMATIATLFTNAALTLLTLDWTGLTSTW